MTRTSKSWNRKLANAQAVRFLTDFFDLKSIKFLPYDILSKKAWLFTLFHNIQIDCLLEGFVRITVARHGLTTHLTQNGHKKTGIKPCFTILKLAMSFLWVIYLWRHLFHFRVFDVVRCILLCMFAILCLIWFSNL